MSKKTLFGKNLAINTANKVVSFLLLEGIDHLDLEITSDEVSLTAFVRNYEDLDDVRSLMKLGGYINFEYEEVEGKHDDTPFMMCTSHYKLSII